jgi:hypothetical protein
MCKYTSGSLYRLPQEKLSRNGCLSQLLGSLNQATQAVSTAKMELPRPTRMTSSRVPSPEQHHRAGYSSTEEEQSMGSHNGANFQLPSQGPTATRNTRKRPTKVHPREAEARASMQRQAAVEHNYHDMASSPPVKTSSDEVKESKKSKGGIAFPFPSVLHAMLERAEAEGFEEIVSWQPHGRAFAVHSPTRFVKEVMPMFFRQTRFASFQRQLSLYGFLRLTRKGNDHGAYYHELFVRGRSDLCRLMQRTRVKGSWVRQSSSPDTEPDFSSMPVVPKSPHTAKLPPLRNTTSDTAFHKTSPAEAVIPRSGQIHTTSRSSKINLQPLPYLQQDSMASYPSSAITGFVWTSSHSLSNNGGVQLQQQVQSALPVASLQAPQSSMTYDTTPLPLQSTLFDPPPEQAALATFLLDVGLDDDTDEYGANKEWYDTEPLPWNTPSNLAEI